MGQVNTLCTPHTWHTLPAGFILSRHCHIYQRQGKSSPELNFGHTSGLLLGWQIRLEAKDKAWLWAPSTWTEYNSKLKIASWDNERYLPKDNETVDRDSPGEA
jgi:hypothetical protein